MRAGSRRAPNRSWGLFHPVCGIIIAVSFFFFLNQFFVCRRYLKLLKIEKSLSQNKRWFTSLYL